ncbi:unnamed protein product [Chironomus riparius]|uniref:Uncharacterized protein n=1 Tax=Chironomus riparius TaxID=315576 RepID=A0A9N9RME8_9DIPT|nr:unnamed protein product [Chironomus riparius]
MLELYYSYRMNPFVLKQLIAQLMKLKYLRSSKLAYVGVGVYTGMYIAQNYDVPKVSDPASLVQKIAEIFEEDIKKK